MYPNLNIPTLNAPIELIRNLGLNETPHLSSRESRIIEDFIRDPFAPCAYVEYARLVAGTGSNELGSRKQALRRLNIPFGECCVCMSTVIDGTEVSCRKYGCHLKFSGDYCARHHYCSETPISLSSFSTNNQGGGGEEEENEDGDVNQ